MESFDPAAMFELPPPGGWSPRQGVPCPDCGSVVWDIARYTKTLKDQNLKPVPVVIVSCHCPRLWEHRRERPPGDLTVLGTCNNATGRVTMVDYR
jgi:hypothetical protein